MTGALPTSTGPADSSASDGFYIPSADEEGDEGSDAFDVDTRPPAAATPPKPQPSRPAPARPSVPVLRLSTRTLAINALSMVSEKSEPAAASARGPAAAPPGTAPAEQGPSIPVATTATEACDNAESTPGSFSRILRAAASGASDTAAAAVARAAATALLHKARKGPAPGPAVPRPAGGLKASLGGRVSPRPPTEANQPPRKRLLPRAAAPKAAPAATATAAVAAAGAVQVTPVRPIASLASIASIASTVSMADFAAAAAGAAAGAGLVPDVASAEKLLDLLMASNQPPPQAPPAGGNNPGAAFVPPPPRGSGAGAKVNVTCAVYVSHLHVLAGACRYVIRALPHAL